MAAGLLAAAAPVGHLLELVVLAGLARRTKGLAAGAAGALALVEPGQTQPLLMVAAAAVLEPTAQRAQTQQLLALEAVAAPVALHVAQLAVLVVTVQAAQALRRLPPLQAHTRRAARHLGLIG